MVNVEANSIKIKDNVETMSWDEKKRIIKSIMTDSVEVKK